MTRLETWVLTGHAPQGLFVHPDQIQFDVSVLLAVVNEHVEEKIEEAMRGRQ